jgi:hypothetical protein
MSYIGNSPSQIAFLTDTFSGNGSTTAFTMSVAPANTASVLVAVSGVLQDPSTYSVSGLTLTFSGAPPTGTGNISARYLGIPASGVTTTAYRTITEFTATAGQTTFTPPSYTVGFIQVFRNGVLLGSADYTATNGTTIVLAGSGATSGDLITTVSFYVSSVLNAIPSIPYAVTAAYMPVGSVIQTVFYSWNVGGSTSSASPVATGLTTSITPQFSTSKILIYTVMPVETSGSTYTASGTIYRNSTNLAPSTWLVNTRTGSGGYLDTNLVANWQDSPATTSATTYTFYVGSSSGTIYYGSNIAAPATIILQEIRQ